MKRDDRYGLTIIEAPHENGGRPTQRVLMSRHALNVLVAEAFGRGDPIASALANVEQAIALHADDLRPLPPLEPGDLVPPLALARLQAPQLPSLREEQRRTHRAFIEKRSRRRPRR